MPADKVSDQQFCGTSNNPNNSAAYHRNLAILLPQTFLSVRMGKKWRCCNAASWDIKFGCTRSPQASRFLGCNQRQIVTDCNYRPKIGRDASHRIFPRQPPINCLPGKRNGSRLGFVPSRQIVNSKASPYSNPRLPNILIIIQSANENHFFSLNRQANSDFHSRFQGSQCRLWVFSNTDSYFFTDRKSFFEPAFQLHL